MITEAVPIGSPDRREQTILIQFGVPLFPCLFLPTGKRFESSKNFKVDIFHFEHVICAIPRVRPCAAPNLIDWVCSRVLKTELDSCSY